MVYSCILEYYEAKKKDELKMLTGMISKIYWNLKTRYKCLLPFVRGEKK